MKVGILAVQGDYEAHGLTLSKLGVEWMTVRKGAELSGLAGLIMPGGESTTQLQFLQEAGLGQALRGFANGGGPILATCAGAILIAREVRNPSQESLGFIDMIVARNAYGRQVASEVRFGSTKLEEAPLEMVFIRAPIIVDVGKGVEVLAESEGRPVLVRQGRALAATFHPELSKQSTVHEYFLKLASNGR
ncbi:MAG: pyridoxal 5'-phosphate synthase glutaminase subunit PdxT [Acidobacteria bacterium]|nr:pyridoxal 5'-phosphate synthase glutaminase subunit PdxT [Acidobacteriota bacterium]